MFRIKKSKVKYCQQVEVFNKLTNKFYIKKSGVDIQFYLRFSLCYILNNVGFSIIIDLEF